VKYFIGPMSKNVVDSIIEFDGDFGFIPSRRQVDYNGGYVNNWSTGEFAKYVDEDYYKLLKEKLVVDKTTSSGFRIEIRTRNIYISTIIIYLSS